MLKDEFNNFSICKVIPRVRLKLDNADSISRLRLMMAASQMRVVLCCEGRQNIVLCIH